MNTAVATPPAAQGRIAEFAPAQVRQMVADGRARLIDVREPDEHRAERIDGAANMPLSSFDPARVASPNGVVAVLHCKSGKRSRQAAEKLLAVGHASAHSMAGGIEAWKAAGLPTVIDRSAPMDTMRQTQIVIGTTVLASIIAGVLWTPWALGLGAFMGGGLVYAGLSGTCTLNMIMAKMPWNRSRRASGGTGKDCCSGPACGR